MSDKPKIITRVFAKQELIGVKHGSLTYYMACELRKLGAPIRFNLFNVNLTPCEIVYNPRRFKEYYVNDKREHIFEFEVEQ